MLISKYVANASGQFGPETLAKIDAGFEKAIRIAREKLHADQIDVIFVNAPWSIIPEYGIGGYSSGSYNISISLDPKRDFSVEDLISSILHEVHHCMRWRDPGYGETLGEAMISEGLATLFEEEYSGKAPLYGQVKIKPSEIALAEKSLADKNYTHSDWFFGAGKIQRWFAYTYGYRLAKAYSEKSGKSAAGLVNTPAKLFFK